VLDLPLPFFRKYAAASLAMRVMGIEQIRLLATSVVVTAILAIPIGVANLVLAFVLNFRLGLFGLGAIIIVATGMTFLIRFQVPRQRQVQEATNDLFGVSLQLVEAVGKLRVADAERRGFAEWGTRFTNLKSRFYDAQRGFAAITAFTVSAPAIGALLLIAGATTIPQGSLSGATFLAFNTAFLQALAAITGLTAVATFTAQAIPLWENTKPILESERETDVVKADPGELRGTIEMSHVSFRYAEDGPLILDDVSFTAEPGQFVAFVGPSGAGKSSVMRILLGFETPEVGTVRFDGKDIETLDPRALRRQMGVVVQTARLMAGDIFTNIVGARPLTVEDAWEAAETAGIKPDIEALPMGMHTFVSEGAGTFSGGQRQRLLIARAVVGRPRILLFDEATSALDNKTQAHVSEAIEHLRATRIVIAHRLSTVRSADKIIVLEAGKIVQSGSYDELIEVEGPFQRLARRQLA
jgi:ATP-binding cassette subfamily C protein